MKYKYEELVKKYNRSNNILIISEYAHSGRATTGLSSFSRNTATSLKKILAGSGVDSKIIVLADVIDKEEMYEDRGNLVIRCFARAKLASFFSLFRHASRFTQVGQIIFEFEFGAFGTPMMTGAIPLLLLFLKLTRKKIIFVLHQVVVDLKPLRRHLGISANDSLYLRVLQTGLVLFYRLIGLTADRVVVLENLFKLRLTPYIPVDKIVVITHGVPASGRSNPSRTVTRKQMGYRQDDFVILTFGFIAWYKGFDRLIDAFARMPRRVRGRRLRLVIAGGRSYAQSNKIHYDKYYQRIVAKAKKARAIITGFVPDRKVAGYFWAADLVVLPYRDFISSSGPFSLAVAHGKPVVMSRQLGGYMHSDDLRGALNNSGLKRQDLFADIGPATLTRVIERLIANRQYRRQMGRFVRLVKTRRVWYNSARQYGQILITGNTSRLYKFIFDYKY